MSANALDNRDIKARIDTPDFAETLAADKDGSFYADLISYLNAWEARIKTYKDAGVSKIEFDELTRISASIVTAERVLDFFVKTQKLTPER